MNRDHTASTGNSEPIPAGELLAALAERVLAQEQLERRVKLEDLIMGISTRFINLTSAEIDGGISEALQEIGEFVGVDRSYVFILRDDGRIMDNTHEWCSEGVSRQMERLQGIPVDSFPWFAERIRRNENVYVPRVCDLPPEAAAERLEWEIQGIKSLLNVPMIYRGSLVGFVGFDAVHRERELPEDSIALLRIVGDIFVNALERKVAEQSLHESEQNYRELVDLMNEGLGRTDGDYVFQFVNKRFADMLDRTPDEMIGHSLLEFVHPDDRVRAENQIALRKKGLASKYELAWRSRDGRKVYTLVSPQALFDAEGNFTGSIGVLTDVTDLKRAEEELRELAANKLEFYRRTILAATDGKLIITERRDIEQIAGPPASTWLVQLDEGLGAVRHAAGQAALSMGLDESRLDDFLTCVGEATTNAVKHANGGVASIHRVADSVLFVVSDQGPGIEPFALPEVALRRGYSTVGTLGMGYKVMLSFADKLYLATGPSGTTVGIQMYLCKKEISPFMAGLL